MLLRKGKQFLLHMWHSTFHSCYKSDDKSGMMKERDCDYDKQIICMLMVDTY